MNLKLSHNITQVRNLTELPLFLNKMSKIIYLKINQEQLIK